MIIAIIIAFICGVAVGVLAIIAGINAMAQDERRYG